MNIFAVIEEKWNMICDKTRPFRQSMAAFWNKTWKIVRMVWAYIYRLRSVIMAVPVAIAAIWLAVVNISRLPQSVGLWLLTDGSFWVLVPKQIAVIGPLAVTALCVLLMLCSKKTVYPWLISVFSLVLPLVIFFTNVYPA